MALCCLVLSRAAEAFPFALRICDDAACAGGNDIVSTDLYQSPSNTMVLPGWSSISVDVLNTVSGFDLNYNVFSVGPDPNELWIYASATDFTIASDAGIDFDGGAFSIPVATLFGGSSNLLFDMSNQLGAPVPSPTSGWSGFEHVGDDVNPYSLTVAVHLSHPGAEEGRTRRSNGPVAAIIPEPASLLLMGGGIVAAMRNRRRRTRAC
jgi:hypothetical protein